MKLLENYSLKNHNTFGMNVRTRYFFEYDSVAELVEFLQSEVARQNRLLPIGGGSNLLFTGDFQGVVLHSAIRFCEPIEENNDFVLMRVGSGVVWDDFCAEMTVRNLGGTENLSYIPGEVGASAVQNIGAYGTEVADIIVSVEAVEIATGKLRRFAVSECDYGYRYSIFKSELQRQFIVTAVVYRLQKQPQLKLDYGNLRSALADVENPTIADVRRAVIAIRREKLPEPSELGSAGSFFKNPVVAQSKCDELLAQYSQMPHYSAGENLAKIPAAWLIEQCGWKGKMFGGAGVYEKQPLVLVNRNNATPDDVQRLASAIVKSIEEKFGISIEPEANYI